ncbi:MAG: imidazole glycerol phosphate synthase subunit HisH [Luteibaculum sp.]
MKLVIIKYNAGNTQSVYNAFKRLGIEAEISDIASDIQSADLVVFPGVGHAKTAMQHLRKKGLDQLIPTLKQPVLGICLGMQLMCEFSEEGNTKCMGIFPDSVLRFKDIQEKIPHMGWTEVEALSESNLFKAIPQNSHFYHVHSYFVASSKYSIASAKHGVEFVTAMEKDNFSAVQFHPEKSADSGEQLLRNFLLQTK